MAEALNAMIAVVGAGPAGIAAATRAAESGASVVVLDDGLAPGGQIWRHGGRPPRAARRWLERFRRSGARLLTGLQVVFAEPGRLYAERVGVGPRSAQVTASVGFEIRAPVLIAATGARELFLPFPGWTLPGVVGVGAAQALVKSGVSVAGKRVVVAGSGPLLLAAAAALSAAGARLSAVAEQAPPGAVGRFLFGLARRPGKLAAAARLRLGFPATRYRPGVWVTAAAGTGVLREAVLTDGRRSWTAPCDLLCCGYGLVPNLELPMMLGCAVERGRIPVDEFQRSSLPFLFCAGEATGIGGVELALVEGEIAGLSAAGKGDPARALFSRRSALADFARAMEKTFALRPELKSLARPDTIVCRCEDVRRDRLEPEWVRRQAKLYTRIGMGPCQGRVCGPALEFLFGWGADSVRIPLRPAAVGDVLFWARSEEEGAVTT